MSVRRKAPCRGTIPISQHGWLDDSDRSETRLITFSRNITSRHLDDVGAASVGATYHCVETQTNPSSYFKAPDWTPNPKDPALSRYVPRTNPSDSHTTPNQHWGGERIRGFLMRVPENSVPYTLIHVFLGSTVSHNIALRSFVERDPGHKMLRCDHFSLEDANCTSDWTESPVRFWNLRHLITRLSCILFAMDGNSTPGGKNARAIAGSSTMLRIVS